METANPAQRAAELLLQLHQGPALSADDLLQAQSACLALFGFLNDAAHELPDPRLAAAHAAFIEAFSRSAARESIAAASLVETTAAHALALDEFDALREGGTDFTAAPQFAPGRTCYRDSAEFLGRWLNINYFEAAGRVADAHLVYRRKDLTGAACPPRFTRLAQAFDPEPPTSGGAAQSPGTMPDLTHSADPRAVLRYARALDKFEPEDTTFDGVPTSATATAADGRLMEEHTAQLLQETDPRTRDKLVNALINRYKLDHKETKELPVGLFRGKTVGGTHQYLLNVTGLDIEVMESLLAQADNKHTKAGAAARSAESRNDSGAEPAGSASSAEEPFSTDQPLPQWASGAASSDAASSDENSGSRPGTGPAMPSPCTVAQRRLNALMAVLVNLDPNAEGKRVTPEIVVHAALEDLRDLSTITGVTAHGVQLPPAQLRAMLCEAKVLSPIYNGDGVIMDIGRDRRTFPRYMKLAVRDRDGGCLVPGCTQDPALIDFHHIKPWFKGGKTSIANCCPLCAAHHVLVHAGVIRVVQINELPYVILPRHLDPDQRPQRNRYFSRC